MESREQNQYKGGEKASRECPECHSKRFWKDGKRKTGNGLVQRFVCRECKHRFSESSVLSIKSYHSSGRQVCAYETKVAKNLTKVETRTKNGLAGATEDVKGKIIEYLWFLKKQGYRKSTIQSKVQRI